MCVGLSLYFLVNMVGGVAVRVPRRWLFGWALPCTLLPLVIAGFAGSLLLSNERLALALLACVVWMVLYSLRRRRSGVNLG
jgi:hypothetical protein